MTLFSLAMLLMLANSSTDDSCANAFKESDIQQCLLVASQNAVKIQKGKPLEEPDLILSGSHPYLFFTHAIALLHENRIEEAAFWFIAGNLRYEFYLLSAPQLQNSGEVALFEVVSSKIKSITPVFNELVYSADSSEIIDRVLVWDDETTNNFRSKTTYSVAWNAARDELIASKAFLSKPNQP